MLILIGSGGFIGATLRFLIAEFLQKETGGDFPISTLFVNVVGSLLLGILAVAGNEFFAIGREVFLFLGVGLCGGFTTFSSFIYDNFYLLKDEQFFLTAIYTAASLFFGFVAFFIGVALTRLALSR